MSGIELSDGSWVVVELRHDDADAADITLVSAEDRQEETRAAVTAFFADGSVQPMGIMMVNGTTTSILTMSQSQDDVHILIAVEGGGLRATGGLWKSNLSGGFPAASPRDRLVTLDPTYIVARGNGTQVGVYEESNTKTTELSGLRVVRDTRMREEIIPGVRAAVGGMMELSSNAAPRKLAGEQRFVIVDVSVAGSGTMSWETRVDGATCEARAAGPMTRGTGGQLRETPGGSMEAVFEPDAFTGSLALGFASVPFTPSELLRAGPSYGCT